MVGTGVELGNYARIYKKMATKNEKYYSLFFLPSYSPKLDPIEGVWKLKHIRCLDNKLSCYVFIVRALSTNGKKYLTATYTEP